MYMKFNLDIRETVKRTKYIYAAYYYTCSFLLKILKVVLRPDDKLVLFVSYGGRNYSDNPKVLYEAMKKDERFKGYRLVWAFRDPKKHSMYIDNCIKIDSLEYFKTALKARCWITNVSIERGLNFKGKKTLYFNTTHTTLPKLCGYDVKSDVVFMTKNSSSSFDCSIAQSEYEAKLQEHMYLLDPSKIHITGLPKNDILANSSETDIQVLKNKLNLPLDKKIVLYAPTYREDNPTGMRCYADFKIWQGILGDEFYILYRAHPTVANETDVSQYNGFIKDVSNYPDNVDLMLVADALISDYSGIFFEFGVQNKPMYCLAKDFDEYVKLRPLYFDIRKEIPGGTLNEADLMKYIKDSSNNEDAINIVRSFRAKYISEYGNATKKCLDLIYSKIS